MKNHSVLQRKVGTYLRWMKGSKRAGKRYKIAVIADSKIISPVDIVPWDGYKIKWG